jgi:predicted RNA-binding protein YlxR (DUF448 family)
MRTKTKSFEKHRPQRSCIACRAVKDKRELVRLVCAQGGVVTVNETGKMPGRGAYLCRQPGCWQEGLQSGRLERALRTTISRDNKEQLAEYGRSLSGG